MAILSYITMSDPVRGNNPGSYFQTSNVLFMACVLITRQSIPQTTARGIASRARPARSATTYQRRVEVGSSPTEGEWLVLQQQPCKLRNGASMTLEMGHRRASLRNLVEASF